MLDSVKYDGMFGEARDDIPVCTKVKESFAGKITLLEFVE